MTPALSVACVGDAAPARPRGRPIGRRRLAGAIVAVVSLCAAAPGVAYAGANPAVVGSSSNAVSLTGTTSVAVAGTYAYTTAYYLGALTAIDISNPAHPVVAGQSASTNSLFNGSTVNIAGGYAFVASKNRNGIKGTNSNDDGSGNSLTILDIATNPARPAVVGYIRDPVNLFGAYGVAVSGHYAFVAAQGCLTGQPCPNAGVGNSFNVIDFSSPGSPQIVATLRNSCLPAPWTGTGALSHPCSVAISGNYAYVTAAYSNRLTVIDISNPLAPTIVASILDKNQLDFPVDVAVAGNHAYVADQGGGLGRVATVDVSDPTHPSITGLVTNANTTLDGAYRIRVRGRLAYVSAISGNAVTTLDVSDPTFPTSSAGEHQRLPQSDDGLGPRPVGTLCDRVVAVSVLAVTAAVSAISPAARRPSARRHDLGDRPRSAPHLGVDRHHLGAADDDDTDVRKPDLLDERRRRNAHVPAGLRLADPVCEPDGAELRRPRRRRPYVHGLGDRLRAEHVDRVLQLDDRAESAGKHRAAFDQRTPPARADAHRNVRRLDGLACPDLHLSMAALRRVRSGVCRHSRCDRLDLRRDCRRSRLDTARPGHRQQQRRQQRAHRLRPDGDDRARSERAEHADPRHVQPRERPGRRKLGDDPTQRVREQ